MEIFDIASKVDDATFQSEQINDLIRIVLTEVFDKCYTPADDSSFGKLFPYEYSFNTVLVAAMRFCKEQQKALQEVSEQLYKLSHEAKQQMA